MVFFKFSNFFAIFLEFSISCRVGTKTEWYLLYSLFLGLCQPILAWNEAIIVFFNFLNFFAIFLEFSISCRVGTKTGWYLLYSLFLGLYQPILAWNEAIIGSFNLFNFFEFSISCRVGTERNGMTVSFSAFSYQFWLESNP